MSTFAVTLHTMTPAAAALLFASIWQGVLLTGVVALALRCMPNLSPAVRTRIWAGVLLLVAILPVLSLLPVRAAHGTAAGHTGLRLGEDWSVALIAVWGTLIVYRGVRLAVDEIRLWGLARRSRVLALSDDLGRMLAGTRRARLCVSDEVNRPCVAGLVAPRILLPDGLLETLSAMELEHVVLHEMEHLRRCDDWLNLVQQVSLVLLPMNPALFWLDRQLCRERELACDDGVLRANAARRDYAACLVKLAEDSLLRKGWTLAMSALGTRARESELVGRVRRILAGPERVTTGPQTRATLGALGVVVLGSAGLLLCAPAPVQFDGVPAAGRQVARVDSTSGGAVDGGVLTRAALRQPSEVRTVLTRAVLPLSPPVRGLVFPRRHRAQNRSVRMTAATWPGQTWKPRLVRSNSGQRSSGRPMPLVPGVSAPPARLIVTDFDFSQPVYAAVPWRNGWLIVQL